TQGGAVDAQLISFFIHGSEVRSFVEAYCKEKGTPWNEEAAPPGQPDVTVVSLMRQLKSGDAAVKARAIQGLADAGADAQPAMPDLIKICKSEEALRRAALEALTRIGTPPSAAVPDLLECL